MRERCMFISNMDYICFKSDVRFVSNSFIFMVWTNWQLVWFYLKYLWFYHTFFLRECIGKSVLHDKSILIRISAFKQLSWSDHFDARAGLFPIRIVRFCKAWWTAKLNFLSGNEQKLKQITWNCQNSRWWLRWRKEHVILQNVMNWSISELNSFCSRTLTLGLGHLHWESLVSDWKWLCSSMNILVPCELSVSVSWFYNVNLFG